MSARLIFSEGYRFPNTYLTYVSDANDYITPSGQRKRKVIVKCKCGKVTTVHLTSLMQGDTQSCRCHHKKIASDVNKTHGLSKHRLYKVYNNMIHRCYDPNFKGYDDYGGRGIKVYWKWRRKNGVVCFIQWVESLPLDQQWKPGLEIDRIDNNGNYHPNNCRFTTSSQQKRNMRGNFYVEDFDGKRRLLIDIVERETIKGKVPHLVDYFNIQHRVSRGWTLEESLYTPLLRIKPRISEVGRRQRAVLRRQIEIKKQNLHHQIRL
jgi:hypothetical protein